MTAPSDDTLARFRTAASPEQAGLLTPIAGGHVFRGTWEALADLDTATCAACGERIKEGGEAAEVVERDGAGVAHRIMCDGWSTTAPPGVLLPLARGLTRQRVAPDDAGDLLPSRASHEAQVELYSAHWDASRDAVSRPLADAKAPLFHIGNAFDALCAALSDEEHALRVALEHDERFRAIGSAPPSEVPAELTAERLDDLDRRAREAHGRAAKATVGPWWASATQEDTPVVGRSLPDVTPNAAEVIFEADWGTADDATFIAAAREDVPALATAVLALSAEVRRLREPPKLAPGHAEDAAHAARLALAEPDEEEDCLRCGSTMSRPEPELEPTPLCHLCAQAVLPVLAAEVERLLGRGAPAALDDLAAIEAAAREDKAIANRATQPPWKWWTANSMRELHVDGRTRTGCVAYGQRHSDGVNDIAIAEEDMALIERAVNGLEKRADALLRLAGEVRRLREENARMRPVVETSIAWNDAFAFSAAGTFASQRALSDALRVYAEALAPVEPPRAEEDPTSGESEEYVIEFRSGTFLQSLDADYGGPAESAQTFESFGAADGFIGEHPWIGGNGGMPVSLERALRGAKQP